MTAVPQISLNVRPLPGCGRCGAPLRRARSITEGLCCCERNTCHTPEPFGCVVCGAFLIGRNDEVLGLCVKCQITTTSVTPAPPSSLSARGGAGQDRTGPFISAAESGQPACPVSEGADVATGEGEAPHPTSAPELPPTAEPESA